MLTNSPANLAGNGARRPRILICDDDYDLAQLLSEYLSQHGFDMTCVGSAEHAIELLERNAHSFDALVLDVMLPGMDGLAALKQLRELFHLPILMMSARGEPVDRVIGLELGADDYLSKPCFPRELLARLHILLRRGQDVKAVDGPPAELVLGSLRLRPSQGGAWLAGNKLHLTGAEYAVLLVLALNAGQFVSREKLTLIALHRPLERFDRAVDVHVSRLRKKLQHIWADAPTINSARGAGYLLVSDTGQLQSELPPHLN
jgi:two-component system, OmpR family, response regulator CpxR